MKPFALRKFVIEDYDAVYRLWEASEGVTISSADTRNGVKQYLDRNPGASFVAVQDDGRIVGAVLGGDDGRRGYIHHLSVEKGHRGAGIGRALAQRVLSLLREKNIHKCHLFVIKKNPEAPRFWMRIGWQYREDLAMMSFSLSE